MEDINNNSDSSSVLQELQTLNESVISSNQKIGELQEYLIVKDNQEKRKEEAEQKLLAEEKAEQVESDRLQAEQEHQEKAQAEALEQEEQAEQQAQEQEVTETYTEILTDIRDQSVLTNQLLAVQGVFIGIVIGLLFMKSIFDRVFK